MLNLFALVFFFFLGSFACVEAAVGYVDFARAYHSVARNPRSVVDPRRPVMRFTAARDDGSVEDAFSTPSLLDSGVLEIPIEDASVPLEEGSGVGEESQGRD